MDELNKRATQRKLKLNALGEMLGQKPVSKGTVADQMRAS
jgi:hypothetical protein